ncbi:MAG: SIS domain-containing protein [Candidatus Berkelbacteria bacterium]|nr:SIS domain-containing protein [Candidatus Berkelbacteria bacterium]
MGIMDSLDKIDLKKADPALMSERIENFPEMCADAYQVSQQYSIPSYYIKVKKVVLIGMGGSGAANDIVKDLVSETLSIPVESIHNYVLPGYVDAETLVIVSSYSGETEEVLSAFISAYQRGVKLIAITTGGKLKTLASKYHAPLFEFELKACPRAAFPYLFTILISVFEKLGFISDFGATFPKLISTLEEARQKYGLSSPLFSNPAKIMAQKLYGKLHAESRIKSMKTAKILLPTKSSLSLITMQFRAWFSRQIQLISS